MNDTAASIEIRRDRMIASRTPEERLRMASGMFDAARALAEVGLRRQYGSLSRAQMRARMLLRFYGECFTAAEIADLMRALPDMQLDAR
jgi:hypothetical protein